MQSYDLFMHNCNNFSNDFAMFLVGKGIPDHITSLPQTVLNTPFGQMLKPQLDQAMRGMTQASIPSSSVTPSKESGTTMNGLATKPISYTNGNGIKQSSHLMGVVHNVTRLVELESLLDSAKKSCAVIFFTSATCPPCKLCYPAYEELATEAGSKAVLTKVDLSKAFEIGSKYQIRATPTFMTFLKGEKIDEWAGANPNQLLTNVRMLVQMAHPPHPHSNLRLPNLQRPHSIPVTYAKVPPLDKLIAKLGPPGTDPSVIALKCFITVRTTEVAASAPLPDLPSISAFIFSQLQSQSSSALFPLFDLLRLSLIDPRVSGYYAEDSHLIETILHYVTALDTDCPYPLRIVTLQLACNLFTSPLFPTQMLGKDIYAKPLVQLVTSSLLDEDHSAVRVSAASLAWNIAAYDHKQRLDQKETETLPEGLQVELVASIVEALGREEGSRETIKGLVFALGLLAYGCDREGEVKDVLQVLGASKSVEGKLERMTGDEALGREVIAVLG